MIVRSGNIANLRGPASGQLVIVLSDVVGKGRREPEVVVAPVLADIDRSNASTQDVMCPPDANTLGEAFVIAAWASASIPLVCVGEAIGAVEDLQILAAVRDSRLAMMDQNAAPDAKLVGLKDLGVDTPAWHSAVASTMKPYWEGTLTESCRVEQQGELPQPVAYSITVDCKLAGQRDFFAGVYRTVRNWISHSADPVENWMMFTSDELHESEATIRPQQSLEFFYLDGGLSYIVQGEVAACRLGQPSGRVYTAQESKLPSGSIIHLRCVDRLDEPEYAGLFRRIRLVSIPAATWSLGPDLPNRNASQFA